MLIALYTNVFGGVAAADEQEIAINIRFRTSEIVCVQYIAWEGFNAFEIRHIRHGEVPGCNDQVIENFGVRDRKSTRLNSSHVAISYAVFCLKKKSERKRRIQSKLSDTVHMLR